MLDKEIKKYQALNNLAEPNGTVIFGGTSDREIPLCELKQAFELDSNLYNRSVTDLSVTTALQIYEACVATLHPKRILLHIGQTDLDFFANNPSDFDKKYSALIQHIKTSNKHCNIAIISLENYEGDTIISEMNKHLRYIAEAERCEFGDISTRRVWNPQQTKDVASFIYATGFIRPLRMKRPIYDLAKILWNYHSNFA